MKDRRTDGDDDALHRVEEVERRNAHKLLLLVRLDQAVVLGSLVLLAAVQLHRLGIEQTVDALEGKFRGTVSLAQEKMSPVPSSTYLLAERIVQGLSGTQENVSVSGVPRLSGRARRTFMSRRNLVRHSVM